MKNLVNSCLVPSVFALCFSGAVAAADIEAGVVVRLSPEEQVGFPVDLSRVDVSKLKNTAKKQGEGATTLGPAAGISYFQVYAVASSNGGTEYPSTYSTSTINDHGGSVLFVYVLQYGYGNPNNASMNGIPKYPFSTVLCGSFSTLHYCSVGETVTGWLYRYDYSGQQNGYFTASANSTASPYGYWSDSIFVK